MGLIKIILNNKKTSFRILLIFIILIFILFFKNGILDRLELASQKAKTLNTYYEAVRVNDSLTKYYFKILLDSNEIERIARHKYGMIRPKEELYIIEDEK